MNVCVTKHVRCGLFDVDKYSDRDFARLVQTFFREGFFLPVVKKACEDQVDTLSNLSARLQRLLHGRAAMEFSLSAPAFQLPKLDVHSSQCERSW